MLPFGLWSFLTVDVVKTVLILPPYSFNRSNFGWLIFAFSRKCLKFCTAPITAWQLTISSLAPDFITTSMDSVFLGCSTNDGGETEMADCVSSRGTWLLIRSGRSVTFFADTRRLYSAEFVKRVPKSTSRKLISAASLWISGLSSKQAFSPLSSDSMHQDSEIFPTA